MSQKSYHHRTCSLLFSKGASASAADCGHKKLTADGESNLANHLKSAALTPCFH